MKKTLYILAAAVAVLLPTSCTWIRVNPGFLNFSVGIGEAPGTKVEQISDADCFTISVPADIIYTQTEGEPWLNISAKPEVAAKIEVFQDGGNVAIRSAEKGAKNLFKDVKIGIGTRSLSKITLNGAADFEIKGGLQTGDLEINANGAADIEIDSLKTGMLTITVNGAGDAEINGLDCLRAEVTVNGAGDVSLAGKAASAKLTVNGAGDIDIMELESDDVTTSIHGLGQVSRKRP